jgi:hypothetical protein
MALKRKCELLCMVEKLFVSIQESEIDTLVRIFNSFCEDTNGFEDLIYDQYNDDIEMIYQNRINDLVIALSTHAFYRADRYFHIDAYGQITSIRIPSKYIDSFKEELMSYLSDLSVSKLYELLDLPTDDDNDQNQ